jgi:hypothetical protein
MKKIKLIFNGNGVIIMRVLRLCSQNEKTSKKLKQLQKFLLRYIKIGSPGN